MHVFRMRVTACPDFVKHKAARRVHGAMKVESDAALFFSGGANQGAQLSFEQDFLPFSRAQNDDQRNSIFRQFSAGRGFSPGLRSSRFSTFRFALGHGGGIVAQNAPDASHMTPAQGPISLRASYLASAASLRPAFRLSKFKMVFSTIE